jgi:hypothetical protein
MGWVLDQQFPLRNKGVGWGLHESGAICGTVGYLKDGRQTLEYSKNYDRYWTGELLIKQVCSSFSQLVKHFVNDSYPSAQ